MADDSGRGQIQGTAQVAFAQDALRGIVLINGGAVIALLTFFGQAWSNSPADARIVILSLRLALMLFVFGVLSGIVAQGLAYLSQQAFVREDRRSGQVWRNACILMSVGGIYFFAHGAFAAVSSILSG